MTETRRENFLGLPGRFSKEADSRFTVLPIPYEQTTTYVRGTRYGPQAILEASHQVELYDEELDLEPYEVGIHTASDLDLSASPQQALEEIYRTVSDVLKRGKIPVALGGEHTLTIGVVRPLAEVYDGLTVLQLDAHADLRDEYFNSKLNHACTARRLLEHGPVIQAGVRSMSKPEADYVREHNLKVFYTQQVRGKEGREEVVSRLSNDVYVTVDLDVFDPGIMPAVGAPEPGGLDWYDVLGLIRAVSQRSRIVGFDVVELCPQSGNIAPNFLAAKLVYKVIGYIVASDQI